MEEVFIQKRNQRRHEDSTEDLQNAARKPPDRAIPPSREVDEQRPSPAELRNGDDDVHLKVFLFWHRGLGQRISGLLPL